MSPTARELVAAAQRLGVRLRRVGDELRALPIARLERSPDLRGQLRQHKLEVFAILEEQAVLGSTVDEPWSPEVAPLIAWYVVSGQSAIPTVPFHLTPWMRVEDPALYRQSLLFDISQGPGGPRMRYGALTEDLRRLKAYIEGCTP